jgi:hypothetical protein
VSIQQWYAEMSTDEPAVLVAVLWEAVLDHDWPLVATAARALMVEATRLASPECRPGS